SRCRRWSPRVRGSKLRRECRVIPAWSPSSPRTARCPSTRSSAARSNCTTCTEGGRVMARITNEDEVELADWSWMEDPKVVDAIEWVASYAETVSHGRVTREQAYSDGSWYISIRPDTFTEVTVDETGQNKRWKIDWILKTLKHRLLDDRTSRELPTDDLSMWEGGLSGDDELTALAGMQPDFAPGGTYTVELAGALIAAMYNGWVIQDEYRPDSDMPRAKPNPARSGNHLAHKMDIERAWNRAPLDRRSKLILAAVHGYGWTYREIGAELGVSHMSAHRTATAAMETLVATLNGEYR